MQDFIKGCAFAALAVAISAGTAAAADAESCKTARFSDVGWTDITATTAVSSVLLTALGYEPECRCCRSGHLRIAEEQKSTLPRQLDASMAADVNPHRGGSVETISQNSKAPVGLVVPAYVARVASRPRGLGKQRRQVQIRSTASSRQDGNDCARNDR